jgi:hypothetical protein
MAKNKTAETGADVIDFINAFADTEQKKADSFALLKLMQQATGHQPKMWGASIIGFGSYHYKYDSGHEGDAPLIGFSPRKAAISLYVYSGQDEKLLKDLGKYKMGKACIYVKQLSDIDQQQLVKLIDSNIRYLKTRYEVQ